MKVRTGFVSNSSSTAFLIFIQTALLPTSVDDVMNDIVGVTADTVCTYPYMRHHVYTYRDVAEAIFDDMQSGDITDDVKAQRAFFHDLPQMMDIVQHTYHVAVLPDTEQERFETRIDHINRVYRRKVLTELFKRVEAGEFRVYRFEYGDESGRFYAMMEGGDHWDRLPWAVVRFSHH